MDIRSVHSRAPTRIDLAGGTVDLWPLYLFLNHALTLNLGIDLYAETTLDFVTQDQGQVLLRSNDQNIELTLPWDKLDYHPGFEKTIPPGLILHYKLAQFFYKKRTHAGFSSQGYQLSLKTQARSPAGAGLGGSSTLSISMIGALATWAANFLTPIDPVRDGEKFIEIVRDVETTVIQVPAGLQDYYGAMYGGLQCLRWGTGSHEREYLSSDLIADLQDRILLFYSGHSRNSGINNWALFKGFIDRQDEIRTKFEKINAATHQLEKALRARDWQSVGQAIDSEWQVRRTLAAGITTPEIDQAFTEARKLAPVSGKACGAGGGGCFFVYLPTDSSEERAKLKKQIQKIFQGQGMRALDFRGVPLGLEVQVTRG